jgi:hypothetical protein
MADLLARVTLVNVSGVAADSYVNDFVFSGAATGAAITTAVINFYNSSISALPVADWISPVVSRTANMCYVDIYDLTGHLDGSPHGSPILHTPFTIMSAGAGAAYVTMPPEMAIVASYHAAFGAALEAGPIATEPTPESSIDRGAPATFAAKTRPKSSLRGRLYIGPLSTRALNGSGGLDPGSPGNTATKTSLIQLLGAMPSWSVWSRRTASTHPITNGWVDGELGVRRTRHNKAKTKLPWP